MHVLRTCIVSVLYIVASSCYVLPGRLRVCDCFSITHTYTHTHMQGGRESYSIDESSCLPTYL